MPTVVVFYDSRSGHTKAMAKSIAEGVRLVPEVHCRLMEADELDLEFLAEAEALAIGSPNYYSYPSGRVKTFFDLAFGNEAFKGKPFVAFSTHGGGGGVSATLERLGEALGLSKIDDGLDVTGSPGGDQLQQCRHLGQVIGRAAGNA